MERLRQQLQEALAESADLDKEEVALVDNEEAYRAAVKLVAAKVTKQSALNAKITKFILFMYSNNTNTITLD